MSDTEERNLRIERVGQLLFSAACALENQRWDLLMDDAREAAREAKVLSLMDKQQTKRKNHE